MSESALHLLIPAYGASPYLAETLRSARRCGDAIVTVVDDGSPTSAVERAARAGNAEYVRLEVNRGIAGAFQACAELSRGDYTTIVGSDDVLEHRYAPEVRRLVEANGRPEMVLPGVTVIGPTGDVQLPLPDRVKGWLRPSSEGVLAGDRLASSLLLGNWLYFPAMAWRTDVLRAYGFRQDMATALDLDLEMRLVFDGARLAFTPSPAFRYRRHPASASSRAAGSGGQRFAEERAVFAWSYARARSLGWSRTALAAKAHPTARLHRLLALSSSTRARSGTALD